MKTLLLATATLFATTAAAVPLTLPQSGRLLDASGTPVHGSHTLTVSLYDAGSAVWTDTFASVPIEGGFYAVVLGSGTPLTASVFNTTALEVGVAIDGGADLLRQPLASTPFAIQAGAVTGRVQLDGGGTCASPADAGTLRWATNTLQLCDGAAWTTVQTSDGSGLLQTSAGVSCSTIHTTFPTSPSGPYWIDPDGNTDHSNAFQASCDMTTQGGGWTRCLAVRYMTGAKPAGWAKNTWMSSPWDGGTRILDGDYTGANYGNFCPEMAAASTQMFGAVTYNPGAGWTPFTTSPIAYNTALFAPGGNGNWSDVSGTSIGLDSAAQGVYGGACTTLYTTNTQQNMQSLCFENNTHHQSMHTGWGCGQYPTSCNDSCNQPCFCTPDGYCGGANAYEDDIVMAVYVR